MTSPTARYALVGVGYWGSKLLRNLVGIVGADNVIAVDNHLDRLAAACREHPMLDCRADVESVLADPDVSAIIIATPAGSHAKLVERALLSGRHVLVEKPLTTSTEDAFHLARLAEKQDLRLMVGHTFLFSPRVQWIAEQLRSQGSTVQYMSSSRLNLGQHRNDANVIWDLAPHDVSIALHLLDEIPMSVRATARGVASPDNPDVAFIDMTFPSGAISSLTVSWLAPCKVRNLVVVTDADMIVYDDTYAEEPVKVYNRGFEVDDSADFGQHQMTYRYGDTIAPHIATHEPLRLELEHFCQAVETGSPVRSDAWFGLNVVAALEAADRSWRIGGAPIEVDADFLHRVS